ncbi:MAG: stage III sporulation protein AD [Lachnospiraceae bacterium]|nr:stage III sporulation protein AD [Lachnospiraceae bacterium]
MSLSLIQLTVLALIVVVLAIILKKIQPDISLLLCLGICILLFMYIVQSFDEIYGFLQYITGGMNVSYIGILVKLLGLSYICEFVSGICKDAGYSSVSGQIEIVGRVGMILISLPVIRAIIETIYGFFGV